MLEEVRITETGKKSRLVEACKVVAEQFNVSDEVLAIIEGRDAKGKQEKPNQLKLLAERLQKGERLDAESELRLLCGQR